MRKQEILNWLIEDNRDKLDELRRMADEKRRMTIGDEVHLRGLIEISNHCQSNCKYCGIRNNNLSIKRYRMGTDDILASAGEAFNNGYKTIVIQSGEDFGLSPGWICSLIEKIKTIYDISVTLSLGERTYDELKTFRRAGADRYLLRFETSDLHLFNLVRFNNDKTANKRIEMLFWLKELSYEVGSGFMIGLPGQTYQTLADDIVLVKELELDMVGVGPYISHPKTPLGRNPLKYYASPNLQAPNTEMMTLKVMALLRILCPEINMPATTALETINPLSGRLNGLNWGANVIMPNITPLTFRSLYDIYPKEFQHQLGSIHNQHIADIIKSAGRTMGKDRGQSLHYLRRGGKQNV